MRRFDEAKQRYFAALRIEPERTGLAEGLALRLAQAGQMDAALRAFEIGLAAVDEREPRSSLLYNSSLVLLQTGQTEEAESRLAEAVELRPDFLEARENLAGLLSSLGRFEEGWAHYREAIRQSPDDPTTRTLAAQTLLQLGRSDEAREQLQRALRIRPDDPAATALLSTLDETAGAGN